MDEYILYQEENRIKTSTDLQHFIHGGKATLILVAPSGKHHTYFFKRPSEFSSFPDSILFVYAIHGNQNFYLGMIDEGSFRTTSKSKFNDDTEIVQGANFIAEKAKFEGTVETSKMKFYHTGRCARCGRKLTRYKSCPTGFGKKCYEKALSREYVVPAEFTV